MSIIKILGCLMIIFSSSILGFNYSRRYTKRVSSLINMQHCIQILQTEIMYTANPLPEALKEVFNKGNKGVSYVFNEIKEYLIANKNSSVYDGFIAISTDLRDNLCFKAQDIEIILSFGRSLGISNRLDQEKHFNIVLLQLQNQQKEAEEEKIKNGKMYKSLGILVGFGLAIALY